MGLEHNFMRCPVTVPALQYVLLQQGLKKQLCTLQSGAAVLLSRTLHLLCLVIQQTLI